VYVAGEMTDTLLSTLTEGGNEKTDVQYMRVCCGVLGSGVDV